MSYSGSFDDDFDDESFEDDFDSDSAHGESKALRKTTASYDTDGFDTDEGTDDNDEENIPPMPKSQSTAKPKPQSTAKPKPQSTAKLKPQSTAKPKPQSTAKPKPQSTASPQSKSANQVLTAKPNRPPPDHLSSNRQTGKYFGSTHTEKEESTEATVTTHEYLGSADILDKKIARLEGELGAAIRSKEERLKTAVESLLSHFNNDLFAAHQYVTKIYLSANEFKAPTSSTSTPPLPPSTTSFASSLQRQFRDIDDRYNM